MFEELSYVFTLSNFEPHGIHFAQTPILMWTMIWAHLLVFIAYQLIPAALLYLVWKRKDVVFTPIFWLFAAFIVLCGVSHLIHIITFWYPIYGIEAIEVWLTGLVSIGTFFAVIYIIPIALKLKSPKELEALNNKLAGEIEAHKQAEDKLSKTNKDLEKMNEIMTGRELAMIELKKQIEALKKNK